MSAYETNIPGSSVYAGAALLAKTAYQKSLARLNQQRGQTIRQAGFKADIDPETGMVRGLGVDQTNMYGDFQQLNRQQAMQDESAMWGAQERGLGTGGGLAAQIRNRTRFGFGAQDAAFGTALQGALSGYSDQQVQMGQERDAALYQAQLAATREAQQNEMWSPTDYSGVEAPDYGPGVAAVTPPASQMKEGVDYSKYSFYKPTAPKPILPAAKIKYYTTKAEALKANPGATLKFTTGKGYYV